MKQKAIISLLWENQMDALRRFLETHEPVVVLTLASNISSVMTTVAANCGCTVVSLESLLPEGYRSDVQAQAIGNNLKNFLGGPTWQINCSGEERLEGLAGLIAERLDAELPIATLLLDALSVAIQQFDLALIVVSEDVTRIGKLAVAWSKIHDIPSLHIAHSIALINPYTVHAELLADKMAVYGERGREGYLDLGIAPERLVVTGNPAWDHYAQLRHQKSLCRRTLIEKYKLDPNAPIVVFGTTWAANLSAHCNENAYADTMLAFFSACETLISSGKKLNAVVKDRPANRAFGERSYSELLSILGSDGQAYFYTIEDGPLFAVAADVLIAVDSNYLVEAMLVDTPAINLMNTTGMLMGPCFEAETGIQEVEAPQLASAIQSLLEDQDTRAFQLHQARQRLSHYHHGGTDGQAASRVAQLMSSMAQGITIRPRKFVWEQYLRTEDLELTAGYHTTGRPDLINMFSNRPRLALDIGCAGGGNGSLVKQRFPDCQVWGIETNRAAANIAETLLDKVLVGRFEDFDLEAEGIEEGMLDSVILADVLEHMYNPWDVMVKLRSLLSDQGQLLLNVPNVANLLLMDDLAKGNWKYEREGLLDITHIRFFTLSELLRFCEETGYKVVARQHAIDGRLQRFFDKVRPSLPCNIEAERMTLKNVSLEEMRELCTIQFYLLLEKNT